jgi:hypothetical protein
MLRNIRPPAKSLALSAETMVDTGNRKRTALTAAIDTAHENSTGESRFSQRPVAIVFGPENGAVSEKLVFGAAREAHAKKDPHIIPVVCPQDLNIRPRLWPRVSTFLIAHRSFFDCA